MSGWILVGGDGREIRSTDAPTLALVPSAGEGEHWVRVPEPACDWTLDDDGEPVPRLLSDAQQIARARMARWATAKAVREMRATAGCMTPLGRVDTDADSQRKISGAAQMAQLRSPNAPAVDWTMANNMIVAHDGPALIAMALAVADFIDACQAAGSAIRTAIEEAETVDAVAAIDITAGYPNA